MNLSKEQLEIVASCATVEDAVKKLNEQDARLTLEQIKEVFDAMEFVELDDESVALVAGGESGSDNGYPPCPKCKTNSNVYFNSDVICFCYKHVYVCNTCGVYYAQNGAIIGYKEQ